MLNPSTLKVILTIDTTAFERSCRRAARAVRRFDDVLNAYMRRLRHRREHPFAHPPPLSIDGHAYRARARRRGRR